MSYSIILYHNYLNKRKKYFKNIFNLSSCLGPSLPVCFLKHPCKQCNSPLDITDQFYKFADMLHFFIIQCHYFSNPAIFFAIFNFLLITCHSIIVCDLESHTIAIKCCFGMQQPHMQYFL